MFFFIGISVSLYSQSRIKGKIIEADSKLPIPFATVVYEKNAQQKGAVTDVFGIFEINDVDIKYVTVSCIGYKTRKIKIPPTANTENITVALETSVQELNEVVVTTKNNPAIPIIRKALENKQNNNFENYENYSYRCYFKTVIEFKFSENATSEDSLKISKNEYLKKRTPFISESVISTLKLNNKVENRIVARKTSGFKEPILAQSFVTMFHHAMSFYNNSISLFGVPISGNKSEVEYVSPLSDRCLSGYAYELENKYVDNCDTIFVIAFMPKRSSNFNGMKGTLFISSNGYAIKNVVAEPSEKGLIGFKFRQDYDFIDNRWFPVNLEGEIGWMMNRLDKANAYPAYITTTKIDSVSFYPDSVHRGIHFEKVYVDKSSIKRSDEILELVRPDTLSVREKNSYHFLDSIGQKRHLDDWARIFPRIIEGKVPLKWIDFNLNHLYVVNEYEGSRLGMGLSTNDKLWENFSIGGFFGYGFKDKKVKYGGELVFNLNTYHEAELRLSYQDNLIEVGVNNRYGFNNMLFDNYLRSFLGYRYDHLVEKQVGFGIRPFRNIKLSAFLSFSDLNTTYAYSFKGSELNDYKADALNITLKYAHGEELGSYGNKRVVNFAGNPIITCSYTRGTSLFNKDSYAYNRLEATMNYTAYNGRIGQSDFRLASGWIDRSLPYGLLFTGEGSKKNDFSLLINNTFQTMLPYEYLSDKYVHLFYSHNFGSLLINTEKFKPQFILIHNTGWGGLRNPEYQEIDFKTQENVYLESGLIIGNILKIKYLNMFYLNFGLGCFYRYGHYGLDKFKDNLAFKLSMSFSLK